MTQRKLIPFLVVGLPAGLLFLGVFAMIRSEMKKPDVPLDPNEQGAVGSGYSQSKACQSR
jgi:hypothetical protein